MGAWTVVEYALQSLVAGIVLTALTWAAAERARMHHVARHQSRHLMTADSRRLSLWRMVRDALRALPRFPRLHLVLGAVGGYV